MENNRELNKIIREILIPKDNPKDTSQYQYFFVFLGGILENNGFNRIFTLIGDKCGKTTLYTVLKETLLYAKKEHPEITSKPFFIDNSDEFFSKISYHDFVLKFVNGDYTALCIDDLTFEHHNQLTPFFATVMNNKPLFLTMNSENGNKLKKSMGFNESQIKYIKI